MRELTTEGESMGKYTEEEKAEIFKEVESLGKINLVCRKQGIAHITVHNWIKKGVDNNNRNYPAENRRLKKKISELELQNSILKDLLKNLLTPYIMWTKMTSPSRQGHLEKRR